MAWILCTISAQSKGNWEICKEAKMWGVSTYANYGGIPKAKKGDHLLFWLAGAGYVGVGKVTEDCRPPFGPSETPWPEGRHRYGLVVPMKLIIDLKKPHWIAFKNGRQEISGIALPVFRRGYKSIQNSQAEPILKILKEKAED